MSDLDTLCAELNELLPAAGWPLHWPLKSLMPRGGARCASAYWNVPARELGGGLALQLYARDKSPVLIVWETDHSSGTAEPHETTAGAIVKALDEYRWVIAGDGGSAGP